METSSRPKKAQQVRTIVKMIVFFVFDYRGLVHHEYEPQVQTVNKDYYQEVLGHLHDAVWRKRPELWEAHNWQLYHYNTQAHSSHLIQV
jgi:hypothetical protein